MAKLEQNLDISKKILNINYTNTELLRIMKNEPVSIYLTQLTNCYEKHSENDSDLFSCIMNSACPQEIKNLKKCKKKNSKNLELCAPILMNIDDCLKKRNNSILYTLTK
jgi:hypothetical protein